ncbi:MAG: flagellar biosynthetic protein FliR [Novosphingobium sp.]
MTVAVFGLGAVEAEFWRWLFVMTRIGAALLAAPLFGAANVPAQVRVIVTGAIAALVCGWTGVAAPPALLSLAGLLAVAGEVLIGLALGFVLQLAFAAPVIAAEIISGAMGMTLAATADPQGGAPSPALGQYLTFVLTALFLALGAHLQWIALLVESYAAFPPGATWLGPERLETIAGFAADTFATAVVIALPVTLILLLVQLLCGVLSRSAPALNLFSLGLPAGVLGGLAALILAAPVIAEQMTDLAVLALANAEEVLRR